MSAKRSPVADIEQLCKVARNATPAERATLQAVGLHAINMFYPEQIKNNNDYVTLISICHTLCEQISHGKAVHVTTVQAIAAAAMAIYTFGKRRGENKVDELGFVRPLRKKVREFKTTQQKHLRHKCADYK